MHVDICTAECSFFLLQLRPGDCENTKNAQCCCHGNIEWPCHLKAASTREAKLANGDRPYRGGKLALFSCLQTTRNNLALPTPRLFFDYVR